MPIPLAVEVEIRSAAMAWLDVVTEDGQRPISRDELANGFQFHGERFPLIDRGRGIRKPVGWTAALSITTAFPKPGQSPSYDDSPGAEGLLRYKYRRDAAGDAENLGLRAAMDAGLPIAWFWGIQPSLFQVISPVYLIAEETGDDQFVLALTEGQRLAKPDSPVEESIRRYLITQTKQRLHQRVFASRVMLAYTERCAVCSLNHRELLDAAHIIPDNRPHGDPVVPNGMALCKIHHVAFDKNILGIRPDFVVQIRPEILEEHDGPMLRHGLQELHGRRLMALPTRRADRPDPARIEERYEEFRAAS